MELSDRIKSQSKTLTDATASLRRSKRLYSSQPLDSELRKALKSAVVKDFELTYELAVGLLYKLVDYRLGTSELRKGKQKMFKEADELGIIDLKVDNWEHYWQLRNRTVHVYDLDLASTVADQELQPYFKVLESLSHQVDQL